MYNVLLADDERLDLDGLKRLVPWEQFHMQVAGAVNNGFDALEHLKSYSIDVLITDVKMPGMTGLELAKAALELHPALKIVFISGYEDFHYAKTAIHMGACNYVLKPIDDDEFMRTLREVVQMLEAEKRRHQLERSYTLSAPYLRNELILCWLEGKMDEPDLVDRAQSVGLTIAGDFYCAMVIEIDDISWKLNSYQEPDRMKLIERVREFAADACLSRGIGHTCKLGESRIGVVMDKPPAPMVIESIIERVAERFPLTVTIGVGSAVSTIDEVRFSYMQANQALSAKMMCGKGRVIKQSDIETDTVTNVNNMDDILSKLYKAAAEYDLIKIDDCLLDLFTLAARLESRMTVYNFSLHIISKLNTFLHTLNEDLYLLLDLEYQKLDVIYQFETIEDIISWFRRKLFEISEKLHIKKQKKNHKLIREVQQYIEERLGSNLTLREVADYFFFSPNHLGFLFKEETGETFSDYIIRRRLETARTYLSDPKLKIYEVANRAGYQNIAYFSRQFKDYFGMSPGEYRKHSG